MPNDLWKHRSENMRCKTCMWFVEKTTLLSNKPQVDTDIAMINNIGRCRRHAPTMSGYPVVFTLDWCGDHKLSEEKL